MDTLSLTQDEAAERVGKSRPAVANALRLLKLPDSVIALVSDGKLSPGHARALLGFKDEQDIIETADLIIEKGLTVRDVEKLVKKRNKEPKAEKPAARRASYYDEVELALTDFLGRKSQGRHEARQGERSARDRFLRQRRSDPSGRCAQEPRRLNANSLRSCGGYLLLRA